MEPQHAGSQKDWLIGEPAPAQWTTLATALQLHSLTATILYNRGLRHIDDIQDFLYPTLKQLHDPFLMHGMEQAVQLILVALSQGDRIVIHGDYDVDGVCSVAVLYEFLRSLGADVHYFIPTRDQDGYGMSIDSVDRFKDQGCYLVIMTDCGISNHDEIAYARQHGMRVIVVDHHTVPETLPVAHAILNPLQVDCQFPFKQLAAVGVAYNLVIALRARLRKHGIFEHIPEPDLKAYLDLVALGTVADVVPLIDENRIFVRHGLEVLTGRRRPGVSALMERVWSHNSPVTSQTISYRLAPRINAAGRMGDASICVELLTTDSYARALELATQLEELNTARQGLEREILEAAMPQALEQVEANKPCLVVSGHGWSRGVLGIVASRLVEKFHRPAILLGTENGLAKGSVRSLQGLNIIELLTYADDLLDTYGGHTAAAGLSLPSKNVDQLRQCLHRALSDILMDTPLAPPALHIDAEIRLSELDDNFIADLAKLAPFGTGNHEPLLVCHNVNATNVRVVGRNHLRARFRSDDCYVEGIGFSMGNQAQMLDQPVSIAFVPRFATYRGRQRLELHLRAIRPTNAMTQPLVEGLNNAQETHSSTP